MIMAKQLKKKNKRIWSLYEKLDRYTFFHLAKSLAMKLKISYKRTNRSENWIS